MKKKLIRYGIAVGIAMALSLLIIGINHGFSLTGVPLWRVLCDATFCVGILAVCAGLLFMVSNSGIFDILSYGMISFVSLFKKNLKDRKYANFAEYKERRKGVKIPWLYLCVIGLVLIAFSFLFLYLYSAGA